MKLKDFKIVCVDLEYLKALIEKGQRHTNSHVGIGWRRYGRDKIKRGMVQNKCSFCSVLFFVLMLYCTGNSHGNL